MGQSRMSFDQADTLQYFLETQPGVTKATVYEQTQDAVIEYDGELKELMEALKSFHYEDVQLPDSVHSSSGRALNVEYKEKLIGHVAKRLFTKYMLPLPIRNVYTIWKAIRYVKALGLDFIDGDYDYQLWRSSMSGMEDEPERGGRCLQCFTLRLSE